MELWDALINRSSRGSLYCWVGDGFERATWREVVADAERMAASLRRMGVEPGTHVATVLTNSPQTVCGLLGAWLAGGVIASLPMPARGMAPDEYGHQLTALAAHLNSPIFVIEERIKPLILEALQCKVNLHAWESLRVSRTIEPALPDQDDLAFIQYSSGSTSTPKGCMLTPRAIAAQLEMLLDVTAATPSAETGYSWLPLSHDMGLFGCLLYCWAFDFDFILSSPTRFMYAPRTWFDDLAAFGATMTAGTSTALHLATRAQHTRNLGSELKLRVGVIGAERVNWETLRAATKTFRPYGLKPNAFMPAYGLAEATLAVSCSPFGEKPKFFAIDTIRLADGNIAEVASDDPLATQVVSCGRPCKDVAVLLKESSRLAEIRVRSPSLSSGYFADPELTRKHFVDNELLTGDLGFVRDGELYVVGRFDDVFSVDGRNIYAREIEVAVDSLEFVRWGCCAIIDVDVGGHTKLVLLMELWREVSSYQELAVRAAAIATAKAGVTIHECLFLKKGTLLKTPSGKIQRFRCRKLLADNSLDPLARVVLTS